MQLNETIVHNLAISLQYITRRCFSSPPSNTIRTLFFLGRVTAQNTRCNPAKNRGATIHRLIFFIIVFFQFLFPPRQSILAIKRESGLTSERSNCEPQNSKLRLILDYISKFDVYNKSVHTRTRSRGQISFL